MTALPELCLTERRPRLCRLAPDEVRFLLDEHRTHLELVPAGGRHLWRVTPGGVAGVILTPRRRIRIEPKFPLCNVLYLVNPQTSSNGPPDAVSASEEAGVLDLLAGRLADLMSERAAAGLHRDYRERDSQGPFLLGRLDVPATLRQGPVRRSQIHSRHDDFTTEVLCNQVPLGVARRLAASPLLAEAVRHRLRQALTGFAGLHEAVLTPGVFTDLRSPRVPAAYRPLVDLCELLAANLLPEQSRGEVPWPALLVSMEHLFEQYLARVVESAFSGTRLTVSVQRTRHVSEPSGVTVRPDVGVDRDGVPVLLLDAKWKRAGDGPEPADLYQVVAYAALLGVNRVVLVYPGGRRRAEEIRFTHCQVTVWLRTLKVSGSLERCRKAARAFGREVRELTASGTA